jgi:hypothetical protein
VYAASVGRIGNNGDFDTACYRPDRHAHRSQTALLTANRSQDYAWRSRDGIVVGRVVQQTVFPVLMLQSNPRPKLSEAISHSDCGSRDHPDFGSHTLVSLERKPFHQRSDPVFRDQLS